MLDVWKNASALLRRRYSPTRTAYWRRPCVGSKNLISALTSERGPSCGGNSFAAWEKGYGQIAAHLRAIGAEIALCFEGPDEVADHPVAETLNVHPHLLVYLGAPRGQRRTKLLVAVDASQTELADVVDCLLKFELLLVLNDNNQVVRVACGPRSA